MGADYTAVTVIGIILPDKNDLPKAKTMVRKRAFEHEFSEEDAEFHPMDGRKLWLDEKELVEADYPALVINDEDYITEDDLKEGQILIELNDSDEDSDDPFLETYHSTDDNDTFYGFVHGTGSSNGGETDVFSKIPDIEKIKKNIKEKLEPYGLWNEEDFGIYTILYCSY
jgi:hypothetical protein